jgi:hypothetical protein
MPRDEKQANSPLFGIARVLVRLDQVAGFIVSANHGGVRAAAMLGEADSVADCVRPGIPQPPEGQRIGD